MRKYSAFIIIKLLILLTLFGLTSCDSTPPSGWVSQVSPVPYGSLTSDDKKVYLYAQNAGTWINTNTTYSGTPNSLKITIAATAPGSSTKNPTYNASANGTMDLCVQYNTNTFPDCDIKKCFPKATTKYCCSKKFTNSAPNSKQFIVAMDTPTYLNCDQTGVDIYSTWSPSFDLHRKIFGAISWSDSNSETANCSTNTQACCTSANVYIIGYGCSAINGIPTSGVISASNSGSVYYIISNSTPSNNSEGSPINSTVTVDEASVLQESLTGTDSGTLWLKVIDVDGNKNNNYGQYEVSIDTTSKNSTFIGKMVSAIFTPIQQQVQTVTIFFWDNTINNTSFKNIIKAMLVLYMVILGIFFAAGFTQMTQTDMILRVVRIGIVLAVINPQSFEFFNTYLFNLFTNGQNQLIDVITNSSSTNYNTLDVNSAFGFSNYVLNAIFSSNFWSLMLSMFLWFPIGWLVFLLLLVAFVQYTIAIFSILIMYLMATTAVQFLIALGPIFIAMILFDKTRTLFTSWINALVAFTMQPVIAFAAVMLLSMLINGAIYNIMSIEITWKCVLPIYINLGALGKFDLFCIYWLNPGPGVNILSFLIEVIVFMILINLLKKVTTLANDLSMGIFKGSASMLASSAAASNSAFEDIKGTVGLDSSSIARRKATQKQSNIKNPKPSATRRFFNAINKSSSTKTN